MATRFRVIFRLAACMVAAYAAPGGAVARATYEHPAIALTERGFVKGIETPSIKKFLGIPYAQPPVGALRWQPPQRVEDWVWIRDATQFANHCPQWASFFGLASVTEDCLYLNVYAPNHRGWAWGPFEKHPVMVYIHGGSLVIGEGDDYDPTRLVEREDVVVVTINYRLGVLGFLPHPALSAEAAYGGSGNYGFMDQQAALQWVQRNIRFFGGDPGRVTIFGESAGGLSVLAQLASPGAAGLFHRAIVQSGAYGVATNSLATGEARGVVFANDVGCFDQTAACLRSVPVETVLAKQWRDYRGVVDGKVLTQSIRDALAKGEFNKVPVMQGTTHDEHRLFVAMRELVAGPLTAAQYQGAIVALGVSPALAAYLAAYVYPLAAYPSPNIALGTIGTDGGYACPGRASVRLLAKHVPVYAYEFNDPEPPQPYLPPVSFPYGAYHMSEIQYVLDVRPSPNVEPAPFTADQAHLSDAMVSYWGRFAREGNPNSWHTPDWAPYDAATDLVQSLLPPEPTQKADFAADHKCAIVMPGS